MSYVQFKKKIVPYKCIRLDIGFSNLHVQQWWSIAAVSTGVSIYSGGLSSLHPLFDLVWDILCIVYGYKVHVFNVYNLKVNIHFIVKQCVAEAFFFCTVIRSLSGNTAFGTLGTYSGQKQQGVYWKYTADRLSVTLENIVVHKKNNRGHSLQDCAAVL